MLLGRLLRHIVIVTANGSKQPRARATLAPRFCYRPIEQGGEMTSDDFSKGRPLFPIPDVRRGGLPRAAK
jgi:hypothetical protein